MAETQNASSKKSANGQAGGTIDPNTVKTVRDALAVLNQAAEKGSTEIREMINRDYQQLGKTLAEIKPNVTEALKGIRDQSYDSANEYKEQAVHYAREKGTDLDRQVREKPWNFIGYAALAGFIIGFLKRR